MKKGILSVAVVLFAVQTTFAVPTFERIWSTQDRQAVQLLRMAGLVQASDWNSFNDEEKAILLKAFDDNGSLTPFGLKLLQELVSARLSDPNINPKPPQSRAIAWNKDKSGEENKAAVNQSFGEISGNGVAQGASHLVLPYDWNRFSTSDSRYFAPLAMDASARPTFPSGKVRILVTPRFAVTEDRYNMHQESEYAALSAQALEELGVSSELLSQHGARLVHALSVFNLISIEADAKDAKALAVALQAEGLIARPASQLTTALAPPMPAARVMRPGFSWAGIAGLGARRGTLSLAQARTDDNGFSTMLADTVPMVKPNKFYEAGYHGESAVALVVDSGLDKLHPDFANRKIERQDFTDDKDNKDYVGHGTHVSSIGFGTGYGSEAKHRGVAYGTGEIMMAKVFGKRPTTTEDTILAGINWGVKKAEEQKKKVVMNLSLGGRGDPNDVLSRAVNTLTHRGHAVVVAAGNSGPRDGSLSSPGLARDVLTVAATDKSGRIAKYSSRGEAAGYKTPARDSVIYGKPDISMPGGEVDWSMINDRARQSWDGTQAQQEKCVYSPGVVASKSGDMKAGPCDVMVDGKPLYTKMSGTSMAAPHAMGMELLVFDYVNRNGGLKNTTALESYAAAREASVPLHDADGKPYRRLDEGAGMAQMDRLYDLVSERLKLGLPVGNISATIATWFASRNPAAAREMRKDSAYRITRFGIVSAVTGNVINSDEEMAALDSEIAKDKSNTGIFSRVWRWLDGKLYSWFGLNLRGDSATDQLAKRNS